MLVNVPLHYCLSSETQKPQSWHCPDPSSSVWLSVCGVRVCVSTEVPRKTPSRMIYSPSSRRPRSISAYYHLVLVSALCHCATPIACFSQWAARSRRLAPVFYFITSPHPFLAFFPMHAIEWNVPLYIVEFWPEMRLWQPWTTSVVLLQDQDFFFLHWTRVDTWWSVWLFKQ